jgi:hypothetical protein
MCWVILGRVRLMDDACGMVGLMDDTGGMVDDVGVVDDSAMRKIFKDQSSFPMKDSDTI